MRALKATYQRIPFCCGLMELGQFNDGRYVYEYGYGPPKKIPYSTSLSKIRKTKLGFICVTRAEDKTHSKWLKAAKFKRVGRWRNPNTRKVLTLWAYLPKVTKKPKKARET